MAELKPNPKAFADATAIGQPTADVVDLTGAPFQAPVENKLQPPKQEIDRFAHTDSWPPLQHGSMPFPKAATQIKQQQQTGARIKMQRGKRVALRNKQIKAQQARLSANLA